ncbi:MAG: hypothetical protein R3335_09625 [Anaerolineales bacterium]|nr:hypothetical protein [Anaerolineales bacterium]
MCCFFTVLIFLGPRFAAIIWWLVQPVRWVGNTDLSAFSSILWPILGIIFLPWTTLMYVILAPGGITGILEWGLLILMLVFDIGAYAGGGYGNRDRIPGTSTA